MIGHRNFHNKCLPLCVDTLCTAAAAARHRHHPLPRSFLLPQLTDYSLPLTRLLAYKRALELGATTKTHSSLMLLACLLAARRARLEALAIYQATTNDASTIAPSPILALLVVACVRCQCCSKDASSQLHACSSALRKQAQCSTTHWCQQTYLKH